MLSAVHGGWAGGLGLWEDTGSGLLAGREAGSELSASMIAEST